MAKRTVGTGWLGAWRYLSLVFFVVALVGTPLTGSAQVAVPPGTLSLQPLIDIRSTIYSGLANEVGLLPTPSGGGFAFEFDPALGIFTRSSESFGPVFGERAETTGRGKFTLNVGYSRHTFDEIDGVPLKNFQLTSSLLVNVDDLRSVGFPPDLLAVLPFCGIFSPLEITEDVTTDVFNLSALYGVTDWLDVGVSVPILRVTVKEQIRVRRSSFDACAQALTFNGVQFETNNNNFRSAKAESTGLGDISFRGKARLGNWKMDNGGRLGVAASLDVKVPTGDEGNSGVLKRSDAGLTGDGTNQVAGTSFRLPDPPLGTGIVRVKPQLALTGTWGAFSARGVTGFELGTTEGITNDFLYQFGVDYTLFSRVTLAADLIGRTALNVERRRIRPLDLCGLFEDDTPDKIGQGGCQDFFNADPFAGSRAEATRLTGSFGVKWNPIGTLLVFANALIPVNDSGVRDNFTFTVGLEWSR